LDERGVERVFDKKMADFQHKAHRLVLHHVEPVTFFDAASEDPDVRFALDTGFLASLEDELRDPVLIRVADGELLTCPVLALKVLANEPPELHRPFAEGVFLRKLFRLFVPAAHEGGEAWEVTQQVREIMQKHFAFQLIACEALLGQAA
jgi:hypothetical protein